MIEESAQLLEHADRFPRIDGFPHPEDLQDADDAVEVVGRVVDQPRREANDEARRQRGDLARPRQPLQDQPCDDTGDEAQPGRVAEPYPQARDESQERPGRRPARAVQDVQEDENLEKAEEHRFGVAPHHDEAVVRDQRRAGHVAEGCEHGHPATEEPPPDDVEACEDADGHRDGGQLEDGKRLSEQREEGHDEQRHDQRAALVVVRLILEQRERGAVEPLVCHHPAVRFLEVADRLRIRGEPGEACDEEESQERRENHPVSRFERKGRRR